MMTWPEAVKDCVWAAGICWILVEVVQGIFALLG